eukprot:CAMPEP_0117572288 /NCGR_PEP_ID=MMETSP0784-20121206/60269_1 /TAXON_ID=39447 /ORGANISM="" /LENGTH=249 /DNA_ID=CAMNT_0005370633 /DNA_START=59 /DNA_END=808 /DNA_ORIENTATION=-
MTLVGSGCALSQRESIDEAFTLLRVESDMGSRGAMAAEAERELWPIYAATLLLNFIALLAAFVASGKTREVCFGYVDSIIVSFCQCLIGPFLSLTILVMSFTFFLVHLAVICVVLPSTPLVVLADAACKKGGFVVSGLAIALQVSGVVEDTSATLLTDFCRVERDFTRGVGILVAGGIMSVVGQVLLVIGATHNYTRVLGQMHELKKLHDLGVDYQDYKSTSFNAARPISNTNLSPDSPASDLFPEPPA